MIEELKTLGVEELERRAREAHTHIRALDADASEDGLRARRELVAAQTLLNEARAELLKDEDLPAPVVVGMKPAYMRPRMLRGGAMTLEQVVSESKGKIDG